MLIPAAGYELVGEMSGSTSPNKWRRGEKSGDCGQGMGSELPCVALLVCLLPPENDVKAKQGEQSDAKTDILVTYHCYYW